MKISIPKYKAVTIDLRETIVGYKNQPYFEYRKFAEQHKVVNKITKQNFVDAYKATKAQWPNYGKEQKLDPKFWWTTVVGRTLLKANLTVPTEKIHEIADALFDYYEGISHLL
jgi:hypothetical protein